MPDTAEQSGHCSHHEARASGECRYLSEDACRPRANDGDDPEFRHERNASQEPRRARPTEPRRIRCNPRAKEGA
jgi:hypothetical protein